MSYKTVSANAKTVNKEWVLVDATDMVVGRISSEVAKMLRGKHKVNYTPHVDCGDNRVDEKKSGLDFRELHSWNVT